MVLARSRKSGDQGAAKADTKPDGPRGRSGLVQSVLISLLSYPPEYFRAFNAAHKRSVPTTSQSSPLVGHPASDDSMVASTFVIL